MPDLLRRSDDVVDGVVVGYLVDLNQVNQLDHLDQMTLTRTTTSLKSVNKTPTIHISPEFFKGVFNTKYSSVLTKFHNSSRINSFSAKF